MTRLLCVPLALAVVVCLVAGTYDGGLSAAVRDLRDYADLNDQMAEASDRDAEMSLRSGELIDRVLAKEAVVKEVIAGRLSLADAAARFATLNGDDPKSLQFLHGRYDGSTLDEKLARNVIDHVSARMAAATATPSSPAWTASPARYGHPR